MQGSRHKYKERNIEGHVSSSSFFERSNEEGGSILPRQFAKCVKGDLECVASGC